MYTLPLPSTTTSVGSFNVAAVAAPPSPVCPELPVPATVPRIPLVFILRTLLPSPNTILPPPSTAIPLISPKEAAVAGDPSAVKLFDPVPQMVLMMPLLFILRIR